MDTRGQDVDVCLWGHHSAYRSLLGGSADILKVTVLSQGPEPRPQRRVPGPEDTRRASPHTSPSDQPCARRGHPSREGWKAGLPPRNRPEPPHVCRAALGPEGD